MSGNPVMELDNDISETGNPVSKFPVTLQIANVALHE